MENFHKEKCMQGELNWNLDVGHYSKFKGGNLNLDGCEPGEQGRGQKNDHFLQTSLMDGLYGTNQNKRKNWN